MLRQRGLRDRGDNGALGDRQYRMHRSISGDPWVLNNTGKTLNAVLLLPRRVGRDHGGLSLRDRLGREALRPVSISFQNVEKTEKNR